jgi:hypothetical protein
MARTAAARICRGRLRRLLGRVAILAGMCMLASTWSRRAGAVRPFVTDDARIIDVGQIETENWVDVLRAGGRWLPGLNVMAGASVSEWLELIAGGGVGLDAGALSVANPVIQPKLLLWRADEDGFPGLALALGVTLPAGQGFLYDEATGYYAIAPVTSRLFEDRLQVHVNVGIIGAVSQAENALRPYWGVGAEVEAVPDLPHVVVEAYAGDPFEALGPSWAVQYGLRWIASDHFNMDLTFGFQPDQTPGFDGLEHWGQLGLRFLFDAFTPGGRPGDFMGARGMLSLRPRAKTP